MARFEVRSTAQARRRLAGSGILAAVVAAALLVITSCATDATQDAGPQNLVMILVDTLRQDRTSAYGYEVDTTPYLRSMAADGAVFDAYSPTSWTRPATASLLTGLHPIRHQTFTSFDVLPDQAITLAEILGTRGYSTMAVSANLHITQEWGFDQGFDVFLHMGELTKNSKARAEQVNRFVESFLPRLEPPYFLYVHYVDPHAPYEPPYDGEGRPFEPEIARYWPVTPDQLEGGAYVRHRRSLEFVNAASVLYDGEVRYADTQIRSLVAGLHRRGLMDNTNLIVTSDHGEEFEEHGRMSHGQTLYNEVVQVPLVMRGPGIKRGIRPAGAVSLIDLMPTVLDIMEVGNAGLPYDLDGASFSESLRTGQTAASSSILLHLDHIDGHILGLMADRWKILIGKNPFMKSVFNLDDDPGEQASLVGVETLPTIFGTLNNEMVETYNHLQGQSFDRETRSIDGNMRARLAALGYVTGDGSDTRQIPERIESASLVASGATGLEGTVRSCVDLGSTEHQSQLYEGLHSIETISDTEIGRWTEGHASLAIRVEPTDNAVTMIVLQGSNMRSDTHHVSATLGGRTIIDHASINQPGPYIVRSAPLVTPTANAMLEITVTPPFEPWKTGLIDNRELGTFLKSVCVETLPLDEIGSHVPMTSEAAHQANRQMSHGLHPAEPNADGRWTSGPAGFYVAMPDISDESVAMVRVTGLGYRPTPYPVRLKVNGTLLHGAEITSSGGQWTLQAPLPPAALTRSSAFVEIETTTWTPPRGDDRTLGVFLTGVEITPFPRKGIPERWTLDRDVQNGALLSGVRPEIEIQDGTPGIWISPYAGFLMGVPAEVSQDTLPVLSISGFNSRCDDHWLNVKINGESIRTAGFEREVCGGPFILDTVIPTQVIEPGNVASVVLSIEPPITVGLPEGEAQLGVQLDGIEWKEVEAAAFASKIFLNEEVSFRHILFGFYLLEAELDGRWTHPGGAGFVLRVPEESADIYSLMLNTVNYRPDPHEITVAVNGTMVFQGMSTKQGTPFQADVPIPDRLAPGDLALVEVFVDPPFRPIEYGLPDERVLGTFVRRTAITPLQLGAD